MEVGHRLSNVLTVVKLLHEWINETASGGVIPDAGFIYTERSVSVFVGDCTVWDDQENDDEFLTFDECRSEFVRWAQSMATLIPTKSMDT